MTLAPDDWEGLPPDAWPPLRFNWDTSPTAYLHTVDRPSGLLPQAFTPYEYALSLGWTALSSVDELLSPHSRLSDVSDFWQRGRPHAFTRLLKHLAEGRPISPPMLKFVDSGHLFLAGGHHRYAIARVVGVEQLPFFVESTFRQRVASMIPVRWETAEVRFTLTPAPPSLPVVS